MSIHNYIYVFTVLLCVMPDMILKYVLELFNTGTVFVSLCGVIVF